MGRRQKKPAHSQPAKEPASQPASQPAKETAKETAHFQPAKEPPKRKTAGDGRGMFKILVNHV